MNEPRDIFFYKSLVDVIDNCKKCFYVQFVLSMLFKIPDALVTTYTIIKDTKFNNEMSQTSIILYSWVFQYLLIVIVPAVIASRLSREVEKIKILLHDKLIIENGPNAAAIRKFVGYVEARPMKFYICNVIPLDASFPFLILNVFVTYLIVAIQLSHLY